MRALASNRIFLLTTIALALSLGACGGGGGGGSPTIPNPGPPGGGGGGSPTPASSASPGSTASPGHTPTPGPSHSPSGPTPTPVSSPTISPTQNPGSTILPNTTGRFGLTQIFDWNGVPGGPQLSPSEIAQEAQAGYDSVWGAFFPSDWRPRPAVLSRYMVSIDDPEPISGHNLQWFQTNHPDWILYGCDSSGNPQPNYVAWSTSGFPEVPLDFSNPAVIQYQIQTIMIPYMQANGYNAVAADNANLANYTEAPNPKLGEGSAQPGWYGCGIYQNGTFVRKFNAPSNPDQSAWVSAMVNWASTARQMLHAVGFSLLINHPLANAPTNSGEQQLLSNIDGLVIEAGFTHYGQYLEPSSNQLPGLFTKTLSFMEYAQSQRVAAFVIDYECYRGTNPGTGQACQRDPNTLPANEVDWALATYQIGNNGGADVFITPMTGANPSYRSEYSTRVGSPCGSYATSGSLYYRKFQNAFVVANPTYSAQSIQLPSHAYSDIEGRTVTNPLTVNGADGYVLLTSGNGCS